MRGANRYQSHYDYFWHRVPNLAQSAFESKFETLLLFLVEAIGVPVLLSLLLLTYSSQVLAPHTSRLPCSPLASRLPC